MPVEIATLDEILFSLVPCPVLHGQAVFEFSRPLKHTDECNFSAVILQEDQLRRKQTGSQGNAPQLEYNQAVPSGAVSSSSFAFFKSSATSASAAFSCPSSASADTVPLTPAFSCAGLRAASKFAVPEVFESAALASASRRSISFCAFATF